MAITVSVVTVFFLIDASVICHCASNCQQFPGTPCGSCQKDWFGTFCQTRNVARGKLSSQSSELTAWGGPYHADLAVDGNTDQNLGHKSCTHTDNTGAWWKVDLGPEMYSISRMKIYLRNEEDKYDRNTGLKVYVDDQLCYKLTDFNLNILNLKCGSTLRGNSVKVTIPGTALTLCEVQVFVCSDGWFGADCDKQCRCSEGSEVCDKDTGYCSSGCTAGKHGDGCHEDCVDGYYGANCVEQCGHCKDGEACIKTNGVCENGCEAKYELPYCQDSLSESSCHCASDCHQWKNTSCGSCKPNWFGKYCQKYNIALWKNATQSSNYDPSSYHAPLAVDGNTNIDFAQNSCTHTNSVSSWWNVILGTEKYNISMMKMFLRSDNHVRNKGLQVYVDDKLCYTLEDYDESKLNITCDPVLSGNVVKVTIPGNILTLCEVQVFVCSDWWFGTDCDKQCQCSDTFEVCDKDTGYCMSGCSAGKYGDGCQEDCQNGWFGENCKKQCYCKDEIEICDRKTGNCSSGCKPGKQGRACQLDCGDGVYGDNCGKWCGRCRNDIPCNKTNGVCADGCDLGFETPYCQNCTDGYYGLDCKACGRCKSGQPCNKTDGVCANGCEPNFETPQCQICTPGWFGNNCSSECGHCNTEEGCDHVTGNCPQGCTAGYNGSRCLQVCTPGWFGNNCSYDCGHCNTEEGCDHVTGNCSQGCTAEYSGPQCLQVQQFSQTPSNSNAGLIGGLTVTFIVIIAAVVVTVIVIRRRKNRMLGARKDIDVTTGETGFNSMSENNSSEKHHGAKSKKLKNNINKITKSSSTDHTEFSPANGEPKVPGNVYENSSTYYNILPSPVPVVALGRYTKDTLDGAGFDEEYKLLHYGLQRQHVEGKKPENKKRNRFLELFPYDHSRVILTPDGEAESDYINASYITGFHESRVFIAAQGPNVATVDDLWRMIWQENVIHIVMLTKLMEMTKKKCEQYWPKEDEEKKCGNIMIKVKSIKVRADFTIREFIVRHKLKPSERRVVTQLHFTTWPDHDVPSPPALVGFWKQYRSIRQAGQKNVGPDVVHCSAGVGRTGTFIALDSLFDEAESADKVNVFTCVSKMREARMNMVQTARQYRFVYESLLEAIGSKGTFYTMPEFDREFGTRTSFNRQQELKMSQQFQSLESLRPNFKEEQMSEARLPENVKKNKHQAIVPANKTRPYLSTAVRGRNNYINAVVIPSATQPLALIVTQTPLAETILDFWRLVYDHDCFTIVCLDNMEDNYPKKDQPLESGPFRIAWCKEDATCDSFMETHFTLALTDRTDTPQRITVYKPKSLITDNTTSFHQLVNVVDITNVQDHKILVHCSDGSRLSGLFCSVLNIITRVKLDKEVDIYLAIRELQYIRPHFIDSYDQYKLCYEMIKEHHRSTTVYANM